MERFVPFEVEQLCKVAVRMRGIVEVCTKTTASHISIMLAIDEVSDQTDTLVALETDRLRRSLAGLFGDWSGDWSDDWSELFVPDVAIAFLLMNMSVSGSDFIGWLEDVFPPPPGDFSLVVALSLILFHAARDYMEGADADFVTHCQHGNVLFNLLGHTAVVDRLIEVGYGG